jgi:myo-inositol-1(or 4)-monophosphatase
MMGHMGSKELEVAIEAALEAGGILMDFYGGVTAMYKPDRSLVTKADIRSEERVKSILEREFPSYSLLGEEMGYIERDPSYVWLIDPLDGTTNYTMRNPFFSVSIALAHLGKPLLGVVYYPHEREVFSAEEEGGAYLNDQEIMVSNVDAIENSVLTFCHGGDPKSVKSMVEMYGRLKTMSSDIRQIGAASLELCYVACGRTEAFMMPSCNPWDVAAGAIIVEEASGRVSGFDGEPYSMGSPDILASNGRLHDRILEISSSIR